MRAIGIKLLVLLAYLAMDARLTWSLLTLAASFIRWDWTWIHATDPGRAVWLVVWLYEARNSLPEAMAFANRRIRAADAQPTTGA